jgi:hypothetical protein
MADNIKPPQSVIEQIANESYEEFRENSWNLGEEKYEQKGKTNKTFR